MPEEDPFCVGCSLLVSIRDERGWLPWGSPPCRSTDALPFVFQGMEGPRGLQGALVSDLYFLSSVAQRTKNIFPVRVVLGTFDKDIIGSVHHRV